MHRNFSSLTALAAGIVFLAVIYVAELYTGLSGTVGYVLVVLATLWFSWNSPYIKWIGATATLFMIAGFFTIRNSGDLAIVMNRVLGLVTIWLSAIFAYRYQNLYEAEEFRKRQLKALFDNATEGMIFINAQGEIVGINPAAENMFGYEHEELNGKKIEVLIPERYVKGHVSKRKNLFEHPVNKPKGAGRVLLARRKNGDEFYSEISLSFFIDRQEVFYIAFIVDISERKLQEKTIEANVNNIRSLNEALDAKVKQRTAQLETAMHNLEALNDKLTVEIGERKKIEERLVKSQRLYAAIARNFPEGVIGVLDKDMKYVFADGQELSKIGFQDNNPIGKRLFELEDASVTAHAEAMMSNVFIGESVSFDVDLNHNIYNLIAVPLPDGNGDINEMLVVMKNITDRKTAERKLVRTIQKEKELSALKSRFVTMASHELRTPLSTMLSSVFLLQNYTGDRFEAQKKTHLDRIKRSIETLTELMNDFLSIGKLEEGKVKAVFIPVKIGDFLKETLAELNSIKKPEQQIHVEFPDEEHFVMIDRQMVNGILRNLVSNAVKYSPANAPIFVRSSLSEGQLEISVEDQGIGIPENEQQEIFKRFYRAENATNIQGTGLGLNIVKKYLNLLNGTIEFKSKVNEGTTFTVHIPVEIASENQRDQVIN